MDFVTSILAQFFQRFKLSNPKLAAVVLLALFVAVEAVHKGVLLNIFPDSPAISEAARFVAAFLLLVTGTSTVQFLPVAQRKAREVAYRSAVGLSDPYVQINTDNPDPWSRLLAKLFERFKLANPKLAAWALLLLFVAIEAAHRGVLLKVFGLPEVADEVLLALAAFLGAVTSTRTVQFLPVFARKKQELIYEEKLAA